MSGLSKMIADFFVRENVIEHEEYEIYKYGSDILIENIGTTIFLICLGFIFNKEISTLIFIAVFAGIRRYSGGYHAKTKLKCYILTITNWAVVIVLQRLQQKFGFTRFGIELIICCMVFMVMFFFAPVENPGKPLFERVRIVNKKKDTYHNIDGYHYIVKHKDKIAGRIICYSGSFNRSSATNYMGEGGCQMKGKKFAEVFASLVKTVAIASVSESSDWYNYQTKEPEGLRKIYLIKHEKK